jgi:hypothetical protein
VSPTDVPTTDPTTSSEPRWGFADRVAHELATRGAR